MYPNAYAPSPQLQAHIGHLRQGPPPPPPRNIPVLPNLHSDYASSVPRPFSPHQQGTGYVNTQVNHHSSPTFPEAFPQAHLHVHARAPDSDYAMFTKQPGYTPRRALPPPRFPIPPTYRIGDNSNGFATPGRPGGPEPLPYSPVPVLSQSLTPRGLPPYGRPSSGTSYEFSSPHIFERSPPPQVYVSQTA
jgi:hypothetical protein